MQLQVEESRHDGDESRPVRLFPRLVCLYVTSTSPTLQQNHQNDYSAPCIYHVALDRRVKDQCAARCTPAILREKDARLRL